MSRLLSWLLAGLLALALVGGSVPVAQAATITMTTTSDALARGDGRSLREAIVNANNNAATIPACAAGSGTDTIAFNISAATDPGCNAVTGVCTIAPLAAQGVFPALTDPLGIDLGANGPDTNDFDDRWTIRSQT